MKRTILDMRWSRAIWLLLVGAGSIILSLQVSDNLQSRVNQVADTYQSARMASNLLLASMEANNLLHEIVVDATNKEATARLVVMQAELMSKNMAALKSGGHGGHERMIMTLDEGVMLYTETLRYVEKIVTGSTRTGHEQQMDLLIGLLERAQKLAFPIRLQASHLANSLAANARKGEAETQFAWYGYLGAAAGLIVLTVGMSLGRRRPRQA